jgi:pSer/pThr/pTyr-binding forkhead associated (FHA) protein/predicted amidophosphoribosyltransferase
MPLCPNCASQQPDGAAFCDECGAKLDDTSPIAAPPAPSASQQAPTVVAGMTTCPVCGTRVTPGESFCDNCGAALGYSAGSPTHIAVAKPPAGLVCSHCGAQLEPRSNFCDMCGAPVNAAVPASAPTPPTSTSPSSHPEQTQTSPSSPQLGYDPASTPSPSAAPGPSPTVVYASGAAIQGYLTVQETGAAVPFPPGRTEVIVGREDPISNVFPEIDLTDHGGDEGGVSRQHARIFVQGSQILIEDLNSTNFTHVNQHRLTPGQPHPLSDGDELRLGRVKLIYRL